MSTQWQTILAGLGKTAGRNAHLLVPAAAVTGALVTGSWVLLGLGLVAYLMVMAADLGRAAFWRDLGEELRRAPPPLPSEADVSDGPARVLLARLRAARFERERVVENVFSPGAVPVAIVSGAVDLERMALAVIRRLEQTEVFAPERKRRDAVMAIQRVAGLQPAATDATGARELARAAAAGAERVAALDALTAWQQQLAARLEAIVSTLEALPPLMLRAQLVRGDQGDDERESMEAVVCELRAWTEVADPPKLALPPVS